MTLLVSALGLWPDFHISFIHIYLYTLAVSPSLGVADNTKETTKTMGISLRSSSNDKGPSRVWMALLEQHSPSSPVFHNLSRFIDAISPTAPTTYMSSYYSYNNNFVFCLCRHMIGKNNLSKKLIEFLFSNRFILLQNIFLGCNGFCFYLLSFF